jgi:hypothetical protein
MGINQKVNRFFDASVKRHDVFSSLLKSKKNTSHATFDLILRKPLQGLKDMIACCSFAAVLLNMFGTMAVISSWIDSETSSKARTLTRKVGFQLRVPVLQMSLL